MRRESLAFKVSYVCATHEKPIGGQRAEDDQAHLLRVQGEGSREDRTAQSAEPQTETAQLQAKGSLVWLVQGYCRCMILSHRGRWGQIPRPPTAGRTTVVSKPAYGPSTLSSGPVRSCG